MVTAPPSAMRYAFARPGPRRRMPDVISTSGILPVRGRRLGLGDRGLLARVLLRFPGGALGRLVCRVLVRDERPRRLTRVGALRRAGGRRADSGGPKSC